MRKRSGPGNYFERLERRETERLPKDIRLLWDAACSSRVTRKLPFKHAGSRSTFKNYNRQAASTRTMTLQVLNQLAKLAQQLGRYAGGLRALLNPDTMHEFFEGHLAYLSGRRKWNICRTLWRVAWEFYGIDAGWLLVGGRRFRAEDDGRHKHVDPTLPARMTERATLLIEEATAGTSVTVRMAIKLRTAAHMALQAVLGTRLSELALADLSQVAVDGDGLVIITKREDSKMRISGRDPVFGPAATIVKAYLSEGMPVLLKRGDGTARTALWITKEGLKAEAPTMAAALRRETRCLMPKGVACGDVRSAAVSAPGQSLADQGQALRHAFGSLTALVTYGKRDRAEAVAQAKQLSTVTTDDIPPLQPPMPPRSREWRRNTNRP